MKIQVGASIAKGITGLLCISSLAACSTPQVRPVSNKLFAPLVKDDFSALEKDYQAKHLALLSLQEKAKKPVTEVPGGERIQAEEAASKSRLSEAQFRSLEEKFSKVLSDCNQVISGMANKAENQEQSSLLLSMSGLVAGAVIAPAATAAGAASHRALIAAASGWAGATNLASQAQRTVGLAGDGVAKTRNAIVDKLDKAIIDATNAELDYEQRFAAIQRAQGACISYAITVPGAIPASP